MRATRTPTMNGATTPAPNAEPVIASLSEAMARPRLESSLIAMTPEEASNMLNKFIDRQLWYELTPEQQRSKPSTQHSILNKILNNRAGWTHAAKAIMQYGLPKLEQPAEPDDATEHINALGQFARDMAKWLASFASSMHAYRQTPEYQKNYQSSIEALEKRRSRPSRSQSARESLQSTREHAVRSRR